MKKQERRFNNESKYRRKDQFNWEKLSIYDRWDWCPVKYDWKDVRAMNRANISKIMSGDDPDELIWIERFVYYVDYY